MNIPKSDYPRLVVIGGGFAGLNLAKSLKNLDLQIVILDKHNYHTFQPLLYQVATGGLESGSIAYPLRKVFQDYKNCYIRLAHVEEIDTENQIVKADIGELTFDYLVIATGSKTNFFGNKEIERHAISMKTIPQSLNIRSFILENFENALLSNDKDEQKGYINFVLVGGGPTGVELAGALAEMKNAVLPKDYPDLDIKKMQINLIQSGDRILNTMSEKSSEKAEKYLKNLGVNIIKNTRVTAYDGYTIYTNNGNTLESKTVIWTAGVEGAKIDGFKLDTFDKSNRIKVNSFNQVKGFENIFAIGDIACMNLPNYENGLPMMAQPSIQQGIHLSKNIKNILLKKALIPFEYKDKGSMATIGRNKAVVDMPNFHFGGFFAWFLWIIVHLFGLIGYKNRAEVLVNWIYNYVRFDRESRLIIRPFRKKENRSFVMDEI
jgi:NADH dehydrogenase